MRPDRIVFLIVSAVLLTAVASPGVARDAASSLPGEFPSGSITSVAMAEAALARAPQAYADVARHFAREKVECHERFLMSSCLADVQQRQRDARSAIRKVEVEARAFMRQERAAERDRAVAERESRAAAEGSRAIPLSGAAREEAGDDASKAADK